MTKFLCALLATTSVALFGCHPGDDQSSGANNTDMNSTTNVAGPAQAPTLGNCQINGDPEINKKEEWHAIIMPGSKFHQWRLRLTGAVWENGAGHELKWALGNLEGGNPQTQHVTLSVVPPAQPGVDLILKRPVHEDFEPVPRHLGAVVVDCAGEVVTRIASVEEKRE